MKRLLMAVAALSIASTPVFAAPCRNTKGKFIKCPPAKATPARCKDAKGRFAMCGTDGAMPAK